MEEEAKEEQPRTGVLFSPEGVLMMSLGILLDLLSIICVILILAFGIGILLAKIVYIAGLLITTIWILFRSGSMPGKGKLRKKLSKGLGKFFKKNVGKLAGKAVPAIGDALPLWTLTIYSELTGSAPLGLDILDIDRLLKLIG